MEKIVTIDITKQPKARLCISCMVCGESVPLTQEEESRLLYGLNIHNKICDKCKAAILHMREQMPSKEN